MPSLVGKTAAETAKRPMLRQRIGTWMDAKLNAVADFITPVPEKLKMAISVAETDVAAGKHIDVLNRAKGYEKSGEWENAAHLYAILSKENILEAGKCRERAVRIAQFYENGNAHLTASMIYAALEMKEAAGRALTEAYLRADIRRAGVLPTTF